MNASLVRPLLILLLMLLPLAAPQAAEPPTGQTSAERVAGMTDAEVRAALRQQLEQESIRDRQNPYDVLNTMQVSTRDFESRLPQVRQSLARWPEQWHRFWLSLTDQRGGPGALDLMLGFAMMLLAGLAVENLAGWKLRQLSADISSRTSCNLSTSIGYLAIQTLVNLVRLGAFFLGALLVPLLRHAPDSSPRTTLIMLLITVTLVRLASILSRSLLAPYARGIRPFHMECEDARNTHFWFMAFATVYALEQLGNELLYHHGIEPVLKALTIPVGGLLLTLIVLAYLWRHRNTITQLFTESEPGTEPAAPGFLQQYWPILATTWLLLIWGLWSYFNFVGDVESASALTPAWWLTLGFVLIDRLLHALLGALCRAPWLQSYSFDQRSRRFRQVIQNGSRLLLLGAALFFISEALGFNSMSMFEASLAERALSGAINILILLLLAYTSWQLILSAIERRLPEPRENEAIASLDGEGGGSGATRVETLLPMVRSFAYAILIIIVVLTTLSILGVEIGPLLAGAGVAGIAIGFGAQKLVQDILSGIFFLLDDAFRRGEYIEAANMRGTVEQISLRSMRLRHHLGAVQTIPYGEIQTVKNLSRDWVTMKLEFRLPYDTDIEKVRKIIKKVGQEMLNDPEMGPNFLLPLKSQGVMRVEESALIFRMKFTCKPGEQWVIRREAYRRVKDALAEQGINFAHRAVHVLLPDTLAHELHDSSPEVRSAVTQSIGSAVAQAEEVPPMLKRDNRIDDEDS
ncbi:mechanosensitive ion channel protein MscS [Marinobacterium nitratireducens]|uniref:Mechanosensitive ion channel protein MscS n=1 Tax=Marinobacterium nitratireducens TaxID=518897 RepID=A0A917ZFW4_9GAMM|nr:mechanosensitive ion channel family protein [Marinobacterium nitratireducens]GGO81077.1 mechanosensitive ion channel protein MscS [Marinobacterium nitratireducens]